MKILSIDPGSTESGFVVFDNTKQKVLEFGKVINDKLLGYKGYYDVVLIEKPDFVSVGAGGTVIEAIFWAGRFRQAFKGSITFGRQFLKKSYETKNDSAVIQYLKDRFSGIKLTKDSWQAMLVICAFEDGLIDGPKIKKKNKNTKK